MLYRIIRAIVRVALGLFYRLQVERSSEGLDGPIILVGNHPNSLIDPALVFVITDRHVTFLAREPLFRAPVLGWILKGIGALPVYRKQDHPGLMAKNEGTLDAAAGALKDAKAITIFPEGKSHSEAQLSEIKTGCARIALKALRGGAPVRIVPVGLTYEEKNRFRSRVRIEVATPIPCPPAPAEGEEAEREWVRQLTDVIEDGLRKVTLNLDQWADLPVIQTAEQLYSLRLGEKDKDPERVRRFARGLELMRSERPEELVDLRDRVLEFRRRLDLISADPKDLALKYQQKEVLSFVLRNGVALVFGLPLFLLGVLLFSAPYLLIRYTARLLRLPKDRVATFKFIGALVMTPVWQALLCWLAWRQWGNQGALMALLLTFPLALYTRYFLERRRASIRDALAFLQMSNRVKLKERLLVEGEKLSAEIERIASELRPRVVDPAELEAEQRARGSA
jgi:glycerol-3-phosphate O-acyltransferase / dihydroxyacetone phosphate acyltransferase